MDSKRTQKTYSLALNVDTMKEVPVIFFRVLAVIIGVAGLLTVIGSIITLAACSSDILYPNFSIGPGILIILGGVLVFLLSYRESILLFKILFVAAIFFILCALGAIGLGVHGIVCETKSPAESSCMSIRPEFCGSRNFTGYAPNQDLPLAANSLVIVGGIVSIIALSLLCEISCVTIKFLRNRAQRTSRRSLGSKIDGDQIFPPLQHVIDTGPLNNDPVNIDIGNQNRVGANTRVQDGEVSSSSDKNRPRKSHRSRSRGSRSRGSKSTSGTQSEGSGSGQPGSSRSIPIQIAEGAPGTININISNISDSKADTSVSQTAAKPEKLGSSSGSRSERKNVTIPPSDSSNSDSNDPTDLPYPTEEESDSSNNQDTGNWTPPMELPYHQPLNPASPVYDEPPSQSYPPSRVERPPGAKVIVELH